MKYHKKFIVISGVTGVGKTTLAKTIYEKYHNSVHLSVDKVKEWINDTIPYTSYEDALKNKEMAHRFFTNCINELMARGVEMVIVEHPFRESWDSVFKGVCQRYEYEYIVINVYGRTFSEVWENLDRRNLSTERHLSHSREESYNVRKIESYKPSNEVPYFKVKYDYLSEACTSLNGDKVFSFVNDYTVKSLEEFLNNIKLD